MTYTHIKYLDIVYDIVAPRLDELAQGNPGVYEHFGKVAARVSKEYRDGKKPDFSNGWNRLAYAYVQMAANASLIEHIFGDCKALSDYFLSTHHNNGKVRVCVFGAGPGTELLGITGWIRKLRLPKELNVDFFMFDLQSGWERSLSVVVNQVLKKAEQRRVLSNSKYFSARGDCFYQYGPEANLLNFQYHEQVSAHDIYIFSYILSELPNSSGKLREFGKSLSGLIPYDTKVIFIDRYSTHESHPEQNKCAIIEGMGLSKPEEKQLKGMMPDDEWNVIEQNIAFTQLKTRIDYCPRRSFQAFWSVATKL